MFWTLSLVSSWLLFEFSALVFFQVTFSDPVEQKDERTLIICGSAGKKQKGKFGDESDDSDDDTCGTKGKNSKSRKSEFKSGKIVKKTKK